MLSQQERAADEVQIPLRYIGRQDGKVWIQYAKGKREGEAERRLPIDARMLVAIGEARLLSPEEAASLTAATPLSPNELPPDEVYDDLSPTGKLFDWGAMTVQQLRQNARRLKYQNPKALDHTQLVMLLQEKEPYGPATRSVPTDKQAAEVPTDDDNQEDGK